MSKWYIVYHDDELYHHGIKGQKWGIRRFQYDDGTLTSEGRIRYNTGTINNRSARFLTQKKSNRTASNGMAKVNRLSGGGGSSVLSKRTLDYIDSILAGFDDSQDHGNGTMYFTPGQYDYDALEEAIDSMEELSEEEKRKRKEKIQQQRKREEQMKQLTEISTKNAWNMR